MYTLQTNVPINETTSKTYCAGGKSDHLHHATLMASSEYPHEAITAVEHCSEPWMKHVSLCSRDLIWEDCESDEEDFMRFPLPTGAGQGLTRSSDSWWGPSSSDHNMVSGTRSGDDLLGSSSRLDNSASSSAATSLESSSRTLARTPLAKMVAALSALPENQLRDMTPPLLSRRPSAEREDNVSSPASSSCNASALHNHQQHHHEPDTTLPRFRQDVIQDHGDVEFCVGDFVQRTSASSSLASSLVDALAASARQSSMHFSESFMASQREIMSQIEESRHQQPPPQQPPHQQASPREELLDRNGSRVRIHNQERVYAAMDDGTARILQCIGCSKHMMATSDMDLVYCPACGTLTPMDMNQEAPTTSSIAL